MDELVNTEIGIYPKSWEITKINRLFNIQQGKSVSKKNRIGDNQKPFLRTKNVFWGKIDLSELDHMHFSKDEMERLQLKKGDLLLCEGGDVGRTAIWQNTIENCFYQNHLHRLRVKNTNEIDPLFSLYWFWYAFKLSKKYSGNSNITTIPNMSKSKLGSLLLPKPDITEQRKIAHILSTIQIAIEQQEKLIYHTNELKIGMMLKLFAEGLNNEKQKYTEIGLVPESWGISRIGDIYDFNSLGKKDKLPNPFPFISMEMIPIGKYLVNEFELRDSYNSGTHILNGDFLLAKITPSFENGKQGIVNIPYTNGFATTEVIRIQAISGKSSLLFLHYYLLIPSVRSLLAGKMEGSTGRQRLSKSVLSDQLIPVPTYSEQNEISQKLCAFDDNCAIHMQKSVFLKELFNTVLDKLMTGQIRVNDIDLEDILKHNLKTGEWEAN